MNLAMGCIVQLTGPVRNVHNFLSQRGLSTINFPQFTEVILIRTEPGWTSLRVFKCKAGYLSPVSAILLLRAQLAL